MSALQSWRDQLQAWAIPPEILALSEDSPWVLPREVFVRRTKRRIADPVGPSYEAILEALDGRGSALDVGAGSGAASLPIAAHLSEITAVDSDQDMLAVFAARAAELDVPARTVLGRWPDVANQLDPADVVTCGHVLYNEPNLAPFVEALTAHARRAVVAEITQRHPLTSLNPLWLRFHGLARPEGPTADDAIAALGELKIEPTVFRWSRPAEAEYATFAELVNVTRRRLCLPPIREDEVAQALAESGIQPSSPPDLGSSARQLVTLVWPGSAAPPD